MTLIEIILILDLLFLLLAGLLFVAGKLMGENVARRVSTPIKVLLVLALLSYIATEFGIDHGANLAWGLALVAATIVILYFGRRKKSND
jgi:hypothetical protein